MALRRKLITAGAIALVAAVMLPACAKTDENGRDGDETETSEETVETEAPTPTPEPLPSEEEVAQAYLDVLMSYENDIRLFEQQYNSYSGITPSINYIDINGDGINELIFKYISDSQQTDIDFSYFDYPVFANVAVYMYNCETGAADCLLDTLVESRLGSWDADDDVCMLDNGNIFIPNMAGRMGFYTQSMTEYQYDGTAFVPVNTWSIEESIPVEIGYDEATVGDLITEGAMHNDEPVEPEEFYAAQQDYLNRLTVPLMPVSSRFFEDGFNMTDLFDRDWCGIPGSFFTSGNYMTLDEFEASADPDYEANRASESDMTAAFAAILTEYEPYIREVEDDEYTDYMTCAYTDLTGDGHPEMIITYCSDYENGIGSGYFMNGDSAVYTYDFASGQAVEMLHIDNIIMNAAGGSDCNIILLDSGNLLVTYGWADEESETYYDEYEVSGNSLVPVSSLCIASYLDEETYSNYYEYTSFDQAISEDEFNNAISAYESAFEGVILMNPWYSSEWNDPSEWQNAVLSARQIGMNYDALYSMLVN